VGESIRGPEDRVFFLTFDVTPHASEWLKKEQLQSTTVKVKIGGGTALYDAVAMACKQRMGPRDWRKPARRIMVLISDGEDILSHITREKAGFGGFASRGSDFYRRYLTFPHVLPGCKNHADLGRDDRR
jgi:hypothetical protein